MAARPAGLGVWLGFFLGVFSRVFFLRGGIVLAAPQRADQ